MTIKKSILKITAVSVVALAIVGCDHDYETLGSNIVGEPGFNADLYDEGEVTATTVNLGPVQTNNLPLNLLGYQNHSVFGQQTANILTQVSLSSDAPEFGALATMDSVVLRIPFFSTELDPDENGRKVFELDSIIGNSGITLSIVESDLFLNNFDPETEFQTAQKYYSNLDEQIQGNLTGEVVYGPSTFIPSKQEIVEFGLDNGTDEDTLYFEPALRIKLSNEFFQEKILNREGSASLANNNNFRNYLRGLYIQAEAIRAEGSMMLLDLFHEDANITLYYTSQEADTEDRDDDGNTTELTGVPQKYSLDLGPATVNTFEQEVPEIADENLYLMGGEGSMAVIEILGGEDSEELEFIKDNDWLINDADLTFYVNRDLMAGSPEPEHLYLYNLKNGQVLADYVFESTDSENSMTFLGNNNHLIPLERDEQGRGIKYRVRITSHIHELLNNNITNVKLGLVVSQNVNLIKNSAVLNPVNPEVNKVPVSSVISPLGTVIYGPDAADEEKRLKLNIYYTEPKI